MALSVFLKLLAPKDRKGFNLLGKLPPLYKMNPIDYDDIPKEELKSLRKEAFREDWKIRWWNAFAAGFAVFISLTIAGAMFPQASDKVGRFILSFLIMLGLYIIFQNAVVEPRLRRAVERKKRQHQLP